MLNYVILLFVMTLIILILYINLDKFNNLLNKKNVLDVEKGSRFENNLNDVKINDNFENLLDDNKNINIYNNFGNNNRLNNKKLGPVHNFHQRFLEQPEEGWNRLWKYFNNHPIVFQQSNTNNKPTTNYLNNMNNTNNIYKYVNY